MHWAGAPDPSAAATVVYTTGDGPKEGVWAVRHLLALQDMRNVTVIGVAKVPGAARPYRWRWGVLAVCRLIRLSALPSHGRCGASVPLAFQLLGGLENPEVWALMPAGHIRRLPVGHGGRAHGVAVATVPLGSNRGILWLEIVGHGPRGPEVAANVPIYVGEPVPNRWAGFAPPDERWIRTVAQAESLMSDLVNEDRRRFGLSPLKPDVNLARIARAHSRDMAVHGYFGHVSPLEGPLERRLRTAGYRAVWCGENIAEADSISGAEADLMRSPGHRANILSVAATRLGIGIVARPHGTGLRWLITQEFAEPAAGMSRHAFWAAVHRLIRTKRSRAGLPAVPDVDALDRIAQDMAVRAASSTSGSAEGVWEVSNRLRQAGIGFRRLEVLTYRVPGPDGMRVPHVVQSRHVAGIGVGVHRLAGSPLTVVVVVVTLNAW